MSNMRIELDQRQRRNVLALPTRKVAYGNADS